LYNIKPAMYERVDIFMSYSGLRTVHNVNDLCNFKHVMLRDIGNLSRLIKYIVGSVI